MDCAVHLPALFLLQASQKFRNGRRYSSSDSWISTYLTTVHHFFWYCDFKFLLENTIEAHRSLHPNKLQSVAPKENLVKITEVSIVKAINLLTAVFTASVHILLYGYLFWGSPQGQSSEVINTSIMFPSNYLKIQITVMQKWKTPSTLSVKYMCGEWTFKST